jgi:Family of unknown function (DUF5996)
MGNTTETSWPELPTAKWRDTCATLHLWTQIVGKIRLARTPWLNHSWHVTLYVTARGLTTSPIPNGEHIFQIDFDFLDHVLRLSTDDGATRQLPLAGQSVASLYAAIMAALKELGVEVTIDEMPNELPDPIIRFSEDTKHASYDPDAVRRFLRILQHSDRVLKQFRTGFLGKASPVHFFWGSFDLAVTRFSGRRAPRHPGGVPNLPDAVVQEAYSEEVSSAGFWPGGGAVDYPAFYSYTYPEPTGFRTTKVRPDAAFFSEALGEFILPYDAVRAAENPDKALLDFLQSTYEAAAVSASWDRNALECALGRPDVVRQVVFAEARSATSARRGAL